MGHHRILPPCKDRPIDFRLPPITNAGGVGARGSGGLNSISMRVRRARQSVLASLIQNVPSEEDGRHESNKPQVPDLIGVSIATSAKRFAVVRKRHEVVSIDAASHLWVILCGPQGGEQPLVNKTRTIWANFAKRTQCSSGG